MRISSKKRRCSGTKEYESQLAPF
uniref:Uncharacterized protein n=1 Tax=Anguilla anguilla TaxID=7936 RepID=A0A0E9VU46_ANGAN